MSLLLKMECSQCPRSDIHPAQPPAVSGHQHQFGKTYHQSSEIFTQGACSGTGSTAAAAHQIYQLEIL